MGEGRRGSCRRKVCPACGARVVPVRYEPVVGARVAARAPVELSCRNRVCHRSWR